MAWAVTVRWVSRSHGRSVWQVSLGVPWSRFIAPPTTPACIDWIFVLFLEVRTSFPPLHSGFGCVADFRSSVMTVLRGIMSVLSFIICVTGWVLLPGILCLYTGCEEHVWVSPLVFRGGQEASSTQPLPAHCSLPAQLPSWAPYDLPALATLTLLRTSDDCIGISDWDLDYLFHSFFFLSKSRHSQIWEV